MEDNERSKKIQEEFKEKPVEDSEINSLIKQFYDFVNALNNRKDKYFRIICRGEIKVQEMKTSRITQHTSQGYSKVKKISLLCILFSIQLEKY